jgi:L-malate glycosyltransferase
VNLPPQIPVAVFMTRFQPGGTERQMIELVRRLDGARFAVHVACFHREGAWLSRVLERATSVVEFPIQGFARPETAWQLRSFARWCRRERIAVVQTCDLYANTFGLPGAALAGVPVRIGSRRELNPDKTRWQIRAQRTAYRCAARVVANSRAAGQMLQQEGLAPESIAVIPNGVDLGAYIDRTPSAQIQRIVTVANLRPEKGHETLIASAAALVRSYPHLRFQIVGEGPRKHELQDLAAARGVSQHVEFLGHSDDVPSVLAAADVFVLPSRSEAFPNSVIEAMAAGLPVIASAVGGLLDLIDHDRTGLLVPPSDAEALTHALRFLIENPTHAAAIGATARMEIRQRYSFERMVRAFEDLYVSSLERCVSAGTHHVEAAGL